MNLHPSEYRWQHNAADDIDDSICFVFCLSTVVTEGKEGIWKKGRKIITLSHTSRIGPMPGYCSVVWTSSHHVWKDPIDPWSEPLTSHASYALSWLSCVVPGCGPKKAAGACHGDLNPCRKSFGNHASEGGCLLAILSATACRSEPLRVWWSGPGWLRLWLATIESTCSDKSPELLGHPKRHLLRLFANNDPDWDENFAKRLQNSCWPSNHAEDAAQAAPWIRRWSTLLRNSKKAQRNAFVPKNSEAKASFASTSRSSSAKPPRERPES